MCAPIVERLPRQERASLANRHRAMLAIGHGERRSRYGAWVTEGKELTLLELHRRVWDGQFGYLPNGRAEQVGSDAWELIVGVITGAGWQISVEEGTRILEKPSDARAALSASAWAVTLSHEVRVNLFPMWGAQDVWFDFDMRELRGDGEVALLSRFIRLLGDTLNRPVLLSLEGADDNVFASYMPHTGVYEWSDARTQ
jgi:hypothetical protein